MVGPFTNIFLEPASSDTSSASFGIQRSYPSLTNINEPPHHFSFSSLTSTTIPVRGMRGPIFVDGPHFDIAFRLFHGREAVVSLSGPSSMRVNNSKPDSSQQFNPLAAKAASISLSDFGPGGDFGFDSFSQNWKKKNSKKSKSSGNKSNNESPANEWLQKGQCLIIKSYCSMSRVMLLVPNMIKPPPAAQLT